MSLPEHNRFLRGLRSWVGFRQVGVEYEREARHAGAPKYTLRKLVRLALSGYVGFSAMPLRLASWLGFVAAATGFGFAVWAVATRLLGIASPRGWASRSRADPTSDRWRCGAAPQRAPCRCRFRRG